MVPVHGSSRGSAIELVLALARRWVDQLAESCGASLGATVQQESADAIRGVLEQLANEKHLAAFELDALRQLWRAVRLETPHMFVQHARRLVVESYLSPARGERLQQAVRQVLGVDL